MFLHLELNRQVGKTSYALKLLNEIPNSYLFVFGSHKVRELNYYIKTGYLLDTNGNKYFEFKNQFINDRIFSYNDGYGICGKCINGVIIIDEYKAIKDSENFYNCLLPTCSKETKILCLG